jgi:hypothetical protein
MGSFYFFVISLLKKSVLGFPPSSRLIQFGYGILPIHTAIGDQMSIYHPAGSGIISRKKSKNITGNDGDS